jgi:hypothetical protein
MSSAKSYQPSLFDPVPERRPAIILDINQGRQLRDLGIEKAVAHADQESAEWRVKAFELLKIFLKDQHSSFMAEDFRRYSELVDFPQPPNAKAWGGIIVKAKNKGLIRFVTTRQVKNKKAHCANAAVWIRM